VTGTDTDRCERMVFGHPPVLANLFGVELWERFSFYGMQGILLIYLYYTADRGGLGINLGAFAGPLLTGLLQKNSRYAIAVAVVSALAAIVYFVVILGSGQLSEVERHRVVAFIPLFVASAAFWSLYQQQFTVVTVYSDQRLDRNLFGWEMPVSFVQSINPVMIIVLSGVFAALWTRLGPRSSTAPTTRRHTSGRSVASP